MILKNYFWGDPAGFTQHRWKRCNYRKKFTPPGKRTRSASFWLIVHMDPVNACFWNLVSGWKNPKTPLLCSHVDGESRYFTYRWRHCPASRLLAFDRGTPRRLITTTTTTTTMADYMLVLVLQKILRLSGLLVQNILLLCHYAER